MQKKKKVGAILFGLLVVLVIVGSIVLAQNSENKDSEELVYVSTGTVERGFVESVIYAKGDVESKSSATVLSEQTGRIHLLNVKEGDAVKTGDVLLELDKESLVKNIRDAKLQLDISSAQYASSLDLTAHENNLVNLTRAYERAKNAFEDAKTLHNAGIVSEKEKNASEESYLQAQNALSEVERNMNAVQKNARVYALQVEAARNAYNDLLALEEKYTVKATMDGVITRLHVEFNDLLSQGSPIAVIESVEDLVIKSSISEYDIGKLEVGMPVRISGHSVGSDIYHGKIDEIGIAALVQNQGQSSERIIPIQITIDEKTAFKPNFSADLEIVYSKSENGLLVPYEAWVSLEDANYVYTVKEGRAVEHEVAIGVLGEIMLEIISETVNEDDVVVLNPPKELEDGVLVKTIGVR